MAEGLALSAKHQALKDYIHSLGSVAVAFSGGVDSTLLITVAHDVLGDKALAVTIASSLIPGRELHESESFCHERNIHHEIIHVDELSIPGFKANPPDRCYICKRELFTRIMNTARAHGIMNVIEGSNLDDLGDYRPGLKAIQELGIKSPLRETGFTKAEIRELSWELGLKTWDKPSFACLASRFVYGEEITAQKLRMVEQAEQLLLDSGFRQFRVRLHGELARIEILPADFTRMLDDNTRTKIHEAFRSLGFMYVTLDLLGYRTGSMNEGIIS